MMTSRWFPFPQKNSDLLSGPSIPREENTVVFRNENEPLQIGDDAEDDAGRHLVGLSSSEFTNEADTPHIMASDNVGSHLEPFHSEDVLKVIHTLMGPDLDPITLIIYAKQDENGCGFETKNLEKSHAIGKFL